MNDRNNTIAGWVLFAGIVGLGAWIVTGEMFHSEAPERGGWALEGGEEGGGSAEAAKPVEFYLAQADVAKGADVFKKCSACHTIAQGAPNGLGPNLWGVVGEAIGKGVGGFAFSEALASHGGNWDWKSLDEWLTSPRAFAPGTKMTFAGLGNPQDRANVIAYLNSNGSNLPLPAAPAVEEKSPEEQAAENAVGGNAVKAEDQPVLNEQQAAEGGPKNVGGEAAQPARP